MTRFPLDFAQLLSPRGRKVLAGTDRRACGALGGAPFFAARDLLDQAAVKAAPRILARYFSPLLVELEQRAPDAKSASVTTGQEALRKTVRMLTTEKNSPPTLAAAADSGLQPMLESPAYRRFVSALAGRPLVGPVALQVLCYRPGDYAGPHTDHHPDIEEAREGYVDNHLTFCTPGIEQQYLVYEKDGHLTEVESICEGGSVTAYRLPFWHYTTPLQTRSKAARRWLVLGSFRYA